MSKMIKLIATASLTIGDGKKVDPNSLFDIDADEGERLVAKGFAREPDIEVPARPSEEKKARIAAEERAAELQRQLAEQGLEIQALKASVESLTAANAELTEQRSN